MHVQDAPETTAASLAQVLILINCCPIVFSAYFSISHYQVLSVGGLAQGFASLVAGETRLSENQIETSHINSCVQFAGLTLILIVKV